MVIDTRYSWQPIATAPELERVMVCGRTPRHRSGTAGYWWYHEDVIYDGKGTEHPSAIFWAPIVLPPFPEQPA
jgi:hypothetical protein